jgi:hypothetical protein
MLDTCVPTLRAHYCRSTTAGFPRTWIDAVLLFVPSFILLLQLINYVICFRLRAIGLLPVARLVQGDNQRDAILRKDRMTRFQYDFSLLGALMDHWRPETHTFHFTVGEMTVTLQDTLLLMGLPCEGKPLRAADISANWRTEFLAWFANIPRNDRAPTPYQEFANAHGPTLSWLQLWQPAQENTVL